SASIYIETSTPIETMGLYWTVNIILVALFSYFGGLFSGLIFFMILSGIYMFIGLITTPNELTLTNSMPQVFGLLIAITLGTLGSKIRINEMQLTKLFENNDISFWTWDLDTNEYTFSEGYAAIYGVSSEVIHDNPELWREAIHPEDKAMVMDAHEQQKAGKKTTITYRFFHSNGEMRWMQDRATPHKDKNGNVTRVDGVIYDITSQVKTEQKMNQLIHYDSLTGLTNKNWFHNYLNTALISARKY